MSEAQPRSYSYISDRGQTVIGIDNAEVYRGPTKEIPENLLALIEVMRNAQDMRYRTMVGDAGIAPHYAHGFDDAPFEARQFDGTRKSIADLLQNRDDVPNGMQKGQWLTRRFGQSRVRVYSDSRFQREFTAMTEG